MNENKKKGWKTTIVDIPIYRQTITDTTVKHYTTTVYDKTTRFFNGFSSTDVTYISKANPNFKCLFRSPRRNNGLPCFVAITEKGYVVSDMSSHIIASNPEFYLRPLDLKTDDLLVLDLNNKLIPFEKYQFVEFPFIREYYDTPDCTLLIRDQKRTHIIDIYNEKFSCYIIMTKRYFNDYRHPLFVSYTNDLIDLGVIPNLAVKTKQIDPYRVRNEIKNDLGLWLRLTNSEWCGSYSQSEHELHKFKQFLEKNIGNGYSAVCTSICYTSNIFVTYIDYWIRVVDLDKCIKVFTNAQLELSYLRNLADYEVFTNVFNFG